MCGSDGARGREDTGPSLPRPPRLEAVRLRREKKLRAQGIYMAPNVDSMMPPGLRARSAPAGEEHVFGDGGVRRPGAGLVNELRERAAARRAPEPRRGAPRRGLAVVPTIGALLLAAGVVAVLVLEGHAAPGVSAHSSQLRDAQRFVPIARAALARPGDTVSAIEVRMTVVAGQEQRSATVRAQRAARERARRKAKRLAREHAGAAARGRASAAAAAGTATTASTPGPSTYTAPTYTSAAPAAASTPTTSADEASGAGTRSGNRQAGPSGSNPLGGLGSCIKGC
jgi:hypothetical protein